MSYVIHLVSRFESSKEVASSALKAEKAKVALLQDEAKRLYLETFEEYDKMQSINNISWTTTNKTHPELHIAAAEAALASNDIQTAKTVVTRFFLSNPQCDQFYCRSKLVYAQVLNFEAQVLNGAELIAASKRAFNEVIDCLDIAIKPKNLYRYKFLIYNATLVGWKIIQPFLREKRAQYFMDEMSKLCSALESINDSNDRRWRLMLLAGSAQCYYDGAKTKEATDQMDIAIDHGLTILDDIKKVQERHENDVKEATELTDGLMVSLRDLDERIAMRTKPPKIDPDAEDEDISKMQDLGYADGNGDGDGEDESKPITLTPEEKIEQDAALEKAEAEEYTDLKGKLDIAQAAKSRSEGRLRDLMTDERTPHEELLISLCMTRVHMLPGDFKKIQGLPYYSESVRARCLIQLQAMVSNAIPDKDWETTFNAIIAEVDVEKAGAIEAETLLDSCRYGWRLNLKEIAINCANKASAMNVTSPVCTVKKDLCEAMRIVAELDTLKPNEVLEIRTSEKEAEGLNVERRIEAVKLVERVLTIAAARMSDGAFIEEVCIVLWNAALPLLQPHLRKHIHRAFTLAVDALEDFASPNMQLRTQLHFEVCKCEDAADFVGKAKIEGNKSVSLDYGIIESESISKALAGPQEWQEAPVPLELDRSRVLDMFILPIVNVLELRSSVYDAPTDIEGQVLMTIQQAKESKSKVFQANMLRKATVQMLEGIPDYPYAAAIGLIPNVTVNDENQDSNNKEMKDTNNFNETSQSNSEKDIEETPLEDIRTILNIDRSNGPFEEFSKLVQCRTLAMSQVSKMIAKLKKKSVMPTLQASSIYCLSIVWDPSDEHMHSLITTQSELHYGLVDSLVESLNELWIDDEVADDYEVACNEDEDTFDPRALGLKSQFENAAITEIKALIITCLQKGMELAMLIKDFHTVQNAIVYFWNLHLHIFRKNLYEFGTNEFSEFVDKAVEIMDIMSSDPSATSATIGEGANKKLVVDERLRLSLSEARAGLAVSSGDFPKGIDIATKAGLALRDATGPAPTPCIYNRKSPAELATKYTVMAARAGAGGKGGGEAPKFDNPLLNSFAILKQAEMLAAPPAPKQGEDAIPRADSSVLSGICSKVRELLEGEVTKYLESLDWEVMNQTLFDQLKEMQAEAWTRLTRMYINIDNIHGAQESAEVCLQLVSEDVMKTSDQKRLSTRVWRWISICERYFGIAIAKIISPEGQDPALQYELRLAAMRHFSLACNFGAKAQVPDCVIEAGICAWNVSLHMVEVTDVRESLMRLQRQIIESLLPISKEVDDDRGWEVCQQMYVSMIDEESQILDWDAALKLVLEAFAQLPQSMHKPLWKWRVVVMSKKGKNVLDSLQKMKESDKSLQARVFGILARSASNPKQQLEAYHQAAEILAGDILRVDYLLETCQWMASSSIPKAAINDVLSGAVDAIYEAEEMELNIESTTNDNDNDTAEDKSQSHSGSQRSGSSRRSSRSKGSKATKTSATSNKAGRKSISKPPSRASSRKGSRVTKTIITTTLPGMEETEGRFTFQHADMAVRAFGMAMLLADDETARLKRALEVVHFVRRGLDAWYQSLLSAYKVKEYMKQPSGWRDSHEFEEWEPSYPLTMIIPELESPLDLLSWCPSAESHPELVELTTTLTPTKVPSADSILSPTLLVHYMLEITNTLCMNGFVNSALGCLGYVRACIWFIAPIALPSNERVALFAVIDTRVKRILFDSGAINALNILPKELGNTGVIGSEYLSSLGSEIQKAVPVESLPNEQLCIFGFESFTHAIQGVKVVDCWMNIASDLMVCGQLGTCERIIRSAYSQFAQEKSARGVLRSTGLLAELEMIRGRSKDALAMIMVSDDSAKRASDALELVKRVSILINSQIYSGEFDMAIETCNNALMMVEALSQVAIQPQSLGMTISKRGMSRVGSALTSAGGVGSSSIKPGSAMTAMSSIPPPPTAGGRSESGALPPPSSAMSASAASAAGSMVGRSSFTGGVVRKSKSDETNTNVIETSFNNISAIVILVISMCECIVARAVNTSDPTRVVDILHTIRSVCDRIDETHSIVAAVHGSLSFSSVQLLHKKGQLLMKLIKYIDDFKSAKLNGIDEEGYPEWLETSLKESMTTYQYASDVIRGILSRIPIEEYSIPNKSNTSNSDVDNTNTNTNNDSIPLQSSLKRMLAVCMLEQAQVAIYLGSVQGDELPPLTKEQLLARSGANSMGEVVDKYLAATLPAPELTFDDVKVPPVYMAASLVSGVRSIASGLYLEGVATCFSTICELKRYLGMGAFRHTWTTPPTPPTPPTNDDGEEGAISDAPIVHEDSMIVVEAVIGSIPKLLESHRYDLAINALSAIVDALGSNSGNTTKSCEQLLWLQSLSARDFMLNIWKNSLNPTSEAAATMKRIEKLESQHLPTTESMIQLITERAYLQKIAPAAKRLICSSSPSEILEKIPESVNIVSIQLCSRAKTLYVCCGSVMDGERKWKIDRLELSERSRRKLQGLLAIHNVWTADATKFVAKFGDSMSFDQMLNGFKSKFADKAMDAAENLLETRFNQTLTDLQECLLPLLGSRSVLCDALSSLQSNDDDASSSSSSIMLLLDPRLQALPWEGLALFNSFQGRIARDFSLHMLGHRLHYSFTDGNLSIKSSSMRVVVDPFRDDEGVTMEGIERPSLRSFIAELCTQSVVGGGKWTPLVDGPPSAPICLHDWAKLSADSKVNKTNIYMLSPGRLGGVLPPRELSVLSLDGVQLMMAMEKGFNDSSYRRLNTGDNVKGQDEIAAESSLSMAVLLSLAGVGCVLQTQWSLNFCSLQRLSRAFWSNYSGNEPNGLKDMSIASAIGAAIQPNNEEIEKLKEIFPETNVEEEGNGGNSEEKGTDEDNVEILADENEGNRTLKPWISLALVAYGTSFATYTDA